jgi:hypothetical protein
LPFIPSLVAFNVLGILPIFTNLPAEMLGPNKKGARQSIPTAFLVSIEFLAVRKTIFALPRTSVFDFRIAGGILLFNILIIDLILLEKAATFPKETPGIVAGFESSYCLVGLQSIPLGNGADESRGTKGIGKVSPLLPVAFAIDDPFGVGGMVRSISPSEYIHSSSENV